MNNSLPEELARITFEILQVTFGVFFGIIAIFCCYGPPDFLSQRSVEPPKELSWGELKEQCDTACYPHVRDTYEISALRDGICHCDLTKSVALMQSIP